MVTSIYLDNNATTRVDPKVLQEMIPYFTENYGNASSTNHKFGQIAAEAVQTARLRVADLIGATDREITFTSGATESINIAIKGVYNRYQSIGKHIITCQTEHKAVLDVCRSLEKQGAEITYLAVDSQGNIDLQDLRNAIRKDTVLIALMYANNETGIIHPIKDIADIASENKVLFFCDATQAVGKLPISLKSAGIDIMAFSAHKIYGPKGIGVLYVKRKTKRIQLEPLMMGGGQENGLRGGTLNVPGIVGIGAAALLCKQTMAEESKRQKSLRDHLQESLLKLEETAVNGPIDNRLSHVTNITFRFLKAEHIMVSLGNIALASGSACSTGSLDPSHVLLAMGLSRDNAHASLRFSLGKFNTKEEIDQTITLVSEKVTELREESPAWQLFKSGLID